MHTPELSDEELDALFRQGAEDYPDELNLGAWARMEQKLDDARVQQLANRKVARWFAAEVGIVAVLLLLWVSYRSYFGAAEQVFEPSSGTPGATVAPVAGAGAGSAAAPSKSGRQALPAPAPAIAPASAIAQAPSGAAPGAEFATPGPASAETPASLPGPGPSGRSRPRTGPAALTLTTLPTSEAEPSGRLAALQEEAARLAAGPRRQRRTMAGLAAGPSRKAVRPGTARAAELPAQTVAGAAQQFQHQPEPQPGGQAAGPVANTVGPVRSATATTAKARQEAAPVPTVALAAGPTAPGATAEAAPGPATPVAGNPTTAGSASSGVPGDEAATATGVAAAEARLEPLLPPLLGGPAPGLPALLPTDSVVRRQPRPVLPRRIFITGLYAPEWSAVRGAGLDRAGHSRGIQVEYLLRPRLRLSVGLLSTMKYYQARSADYTWAQPPMYPVERISAVCRITDIPVNLRYDALQGVRYRLFVSAGLSTLLMRDETYHYGYTYYGTYYSRSWQIRNGKNHPFSVVNLSAGLERQLTPHWALQAEPYLKMPLGGVGQGQVRLSSGGVFVGLKYGL